MVYDIYKDVECTCTPSKNSKYTSTSATPLHYTKVDIFSILTHLRLPSVTSKSASKKSEYSENGQ